MEDDNYITYNNFKIYFGPSPTSNNLNIFLEGFKKFNIHTIVRLCNLNYNIESNKVQIINMLISTSTPSKEIIKEWINILENINGNIYIHCDSGLGRSPTMIAIAMIQKGFEPYSAVHTLRTKNNKLLNNYQLKFIFDYKVKKNSFMETIIKCLSK